MFEYFPNMYKLDLNWKCWYDVCISRWWSATTQVHQSAGHRLLWLLYLFLRQRMKMAGLLSEEKSEEEEYDELWILENDDDLCPPRGQRDWLQPWWQHHGRVHNQKNFFWERFTSWLQCFYHFWQLLFLIFDKNSIRTA